jgi:hypothetical protein
MAAREVIPDLPMIRKVALENLKKEYATTGQAEAAIPAAIESYYKQNHGDIYAKRPADVAASAKAVLSIWQHNVFPEMKVKWGQYPNNIGHNDFPGCFRCHDDEHKSADGKAIGQDCNACHGLLAMEEKDPKILKELGLVE